MPAARHPAASRARVQVPMTEKYSNHMPRPAPRPAHPTAAATMRAFLRSRSTRFACRQQLAGAHRFRDTVRAVARGDWACWSGDSCRLRRVRCSIVGARNHD
ncbi:hypothetical protein AMAG_17949 [Allomyces macrogynus ATCC 38327]|uniref:Uncharacterized protein n=1 Tax=Allomyces macrogynus (strain ATCC 38327) TaxID=578462 RepID=A0A0L0S282_ALLM3|nr:hypothetical protein AMAG_17949 [Allomyces macrogynus ATCC 38327]|eukprot:KNE56663.1 hypothetical protein AMAG_17949 [Allomyces macrogynus ATCC 38327]